MSIRHGLLALLERGPMYGYQLRMNFEESTGGTWPLNIGQVYTTLSRLERDKPVCPLAESDTGQRPYEITDAGRAELALWFATPISHDDRPRDELATAVTATRTTTRRSTTSTRPPTSATRSTTRTSSSTKTRPTRCSSATVCGGEPTG